MKRRIIENRYECLHKIGEGGMACVYEARDRKLNRRVAVKILHEHMQSRGELRQRFIQEAHAVSKLRHTNILEIYDFSGESSPELWVVTELIDGVDLSRYVRDFEDRRINQYVATFIVREIALALEESHTHGIIHRDIKPSNIMVTKNGRIKLMDFGIAKDIATSNLTQIGTFMGSPSYMSPEQIRGGKISDAADLYSLCILFYELVTGKVPFIGTQTTEILTKILETDPVPPKNKVANLLPALNEFILRGLEKNPLSRFSDATEMDEKLNSVLKKSGFGDSRVELELLFRQPTDYANRLKDLENQATPTQIIKKTLEPQKADHAFAQKPNTSINDRTRQSDFKNIPQAPVSPRLQKQNSASNHSAPQSKAFPFQWFILPILLLIAILTTLKLKNPDSSSNRPTSVRETLETKTPTDATNRPPKNIVVPPIEVKAPDSPNHVPNSTVAKKPKVPDSPNQTTVAPKVYTSKPTKPLPSELIQTRPKPKPVKTVVVNSNYEVEPKVSRPSLPTSTDTHIRPNVTGPKSDTGNLIISTTIEGRLYLNGKDFGRVSSKESILSLPPGGYEVNVLKEGHKAGKRIVRIEGGKTTKLLGLKLEREKIQALYRLIVSTSSPQVLVKINSPKVNESFSLSNSAKSISLPAGIYNVRASSQGKAIERNLSLPSQFDADGSTTFIAEFD
jgi:serine/threonine protein kinase